MRVIVPLFVFAALDVAGCANDPVYLPAPMVMEAGVIDETTGALSEAKASLQLPIKLETEADRMKRDALAAQLGVDVPYVKVGDIEIEVEWTIKNLDTRAGQAKIQLNGANEMFEYDPSVIDLSQGDDEAPPTPGLEGDIPIDVPGGGTVSGLFTEDQLREASIDLDQITRGNVNPFRATLTVSKNVASFQPLTMAVLVDGEYQQEPTGDPIPRAAFREMTRVDLVFRAGAHMTLEFTVRVRDLRGILHNLLLAAATDKPGELATFMPMLYNVTPPAGM